MYRQSCSKFDQLNIYFSVLFIIHIMFQLPTSHAPSLHPSSLKSGTHMSSLHFLFKKYCLLCANVGRALDSDSVSICVLTLLIVSIVVLNKSFDFHGPHFL
jgi:hypothetical protein